jgi:polar amino acid transport system ATP-binding protein
MSAALVQPPAPGVTIPVVQVRGATKSFGTHRVLDDVHLDVDGGKVTVILGPSGSGKSTLLRSINHLEKLDAGFVSVDGELVGVKVVRGRLHELSERAILRQRARIGFVFQSFNLFPHLTVLDNVVEAPVAALGRDKTEVRAEARTLLERVGLADKINAYPRQLSGGQQQRVAIARALALRPRLILLDEPTSALDPELVGEVLEVIKDLAAGGTTMIIVTHEIAFAREVADTVVFLDGGQVLEQGPPGQVLIHPQHPRTAAFLTRVR